MSPELELGKRSWNKFKLLAHRFRNKWFELRQKLNIPLTLSVGATRDRFYPFGGHIKKYYMRTYFEYDELAWVLQQENIRVFFDIGANLGIYSLLVALRFPNCQVHAFEPCSMTFGYLLKNKTLNRVCNIKENRVALADVSGQGSLLLNEGEEDGLNSLKSRSHRSANVIGEESVSIITLDSYCEQQNVHQVDLIKLDVEGAELRVLEGAVILLSSKHPPLILFEYPGPRARDFGYKGEDIFAFLKRLGYEVYNFSGGSLQSLESPYSGMLIAKKNILN